MRLSMDSFLVSSIISSGLVVGCGECSLVFVEIGFDVL